MTLGVGRLVGRALQQPQRTGHGEPHAPDSLPGRPGSVQGERWRSGGPGPGSGEADAGRSSVSFLLAPGLLLARRRAPCRPHTHLSPPAFPDAARAATTALAPVRQPPSIQLHVDSGYSVRTGSSLRLMRGHGPLVAKPRASPSTVTAEGYGCELDLMVRTCGPTWLSDVGCGRGSKETELDQMCVVEWIRNCKNV